LGSGKGISLNDLIDTISEVIGNKITPEYVNVRKGDVSRIILDITRIKKEYAWEPRTSLFEGIKNTWNWIHRIT